MLKNKKLCFFVVILGLCFSGLLSDAATNPAEIGKARKAWEKYLENSDSNSALKAFERLASRKNPAPLEYLGYATLLDSREHLGDAQTAYSLTLEAVWREILSFTPGQIESLKQLQGNPAEVGLGKGTEQILDHAVWLWATGSVALHSADKISPYSIHPEDYLKILESIAESQSVPDWPGFHQLQAEVLTLLSQQKMKQGKWKEAEAVSNSIGFLKDFLYIGPFPNKEEAGYTEVYPPENEFNPDIEYEGKLYPVRWNVLSPQPTWGYVDLKSLIEPVENSTVYALSFVYSEKQRPVALELGHAGAAKVWVAGHPAIGNDAYHGATPFQVRANAELRPGWNPILLKICSEEPEKYGFYLRLTTPEGKALGETIQDDANPVRYWKTSESLPEVTSGWPVEEEPEQILEPINRQWLSRLTKPERDNLTSTLANWLSASYLHYHDNLDEHSTEALDLLRLAEKPFPDSSLIQRWIGALELDENRSLQAYEMAARLDQNEVSACSELGRNYLQKPYKDRALEMLEKGLARNSKSPRLWLLKGEALLDIGSSEFLARQAFQQGIALGPESYYGYYRLAQTQDSFSTLSEKIKQLEISLSKDRIIPEIRLALMQSYIRAGLMDQAVALAEEGIRIDPYEGGWFILLARHFRAVKDWDRANAMIARSLEIQPYSPEANTLAGEIYHEQGRSEEARQAWQLALRVRPNNPNLEEYINMVFEDADDYYKPYRIDLSDLPEVSSEEYPESKMVILLDQQVQKVYSNGTSSQTTHLIRKALTDSGVNGLKSYPIYFEPGQEKVKVKRARVIRPDGTFFDAPRPVERMARGGGSSRVYGDYSIMEVSFPAVEKGAIVDLEYEVQETGKNIYVDYFGSQFYFGQFDPTLLTEYVLIVPGEREFYSKLIQPDARYALPESSQIARLPEDRLQTGNFFCEFTPENQKVRVWNYTHRPRISQESSMPASSELVPYLKVSTFKTWDDMAKWYWDLIKDQFLVDEPLRQQIDKLLKDYSEKTGIPIKDLSDLDIVKALNGFVNTQIRYLGLEFGIHGYKPHRVSDILNAQYGDCKDKATLLVAMAGEKGIPGRIALLRTSDRGKIDYELPSLHLFNHAIIYFPDLDGKHFILDGTAQYYGTQDLPGGDQGTKLLTIIPGGKQEFVDSPIYTADINQAQYQTSLVLEPDGSARGNRHTDYRGLFNPSVRSIYQNRGKVKEIIEQQFGSVFPGSTVDSIEISDLDNYETPEWIQFQLSIPRFADQPAGQENRLTFRPVLFPMEMSRSYAALPRREHELVLYYNWSRTRRIEVTIPDGFKVIQLPQNQEESTPFGSIKQNSSVVENKIIVEHEVRLQVDNLRIPATEYEAFRNFCAEVDRAEEQQVILEKTE